MPAAIAFVPVNLAAILAACRDLRGQTFANGVDCGLWLEAFVRLAWETGLRQGDLLHLQWDQLGDDGAFRVVRLSPETAAAVRALNRPDDRFVFTAEGRSVTLVWMRLLRRAGVGHGSLGELRCSALRRRLRE